MKYAGVSGKTFKYYGANGNEVFGEAAWEALLAGYVGQDVRVSYIVDGDTISFKIITVGASSGDGLVKHTPVAKNNAPVAKVVEDQTIAANNTAGLTFTATQVASDADTTDTLKILTAYTSDASVATANVAGDQLSFTVSPKATGSTVVTLVVSDGKDNVNVSFKVNVTVASYFTLVGNPAVDYSETLATQATAVLTPGAIFAGPFGLTVTNNNVAPATTTVVDVTLPANATVAQIAQAITDEAATLGLDNITAVVDGSNVKLTSGKLVDAVTITNSTALANVTFGSAVAGSPVVKTPAKYSFKVTGVPLLQVK